MLALLDVDVTKVQVPSLTDSTFFGRVFLQKKDIVDMDIDARLKKAIALTLRYKAPIFVYKYVYNGETRLRDELKRVESGD